MTDINRAIFDNNLDEVNRILNSDLDLDNLGSNGMSPLMVAIEHENIRMIELLLTHGATINTFDHQGFTPLHLAVDVSIDGNIQTGGLPGDEPLFIIGFLLKNGADISAKNHRGETALDIAKGYGSKKVIRFLSDHGAYKTFKFVRV